MRFFLYELDVRVYNAETTSTTTPGRPAKQLLHWVGLRPGRMRACVQSTWTYVRKWIHACVCACMYDVRIRRRVCAWYEREYVRGYVRGA